MESTIELSLWCDETLEIAPSLSPSYWPLQPECQPAITRRKIKRENSESQKHKRKYKSYSNDDKISFLDLAERIGKKRAAIQMKISWSTAKTWIKKDESLKQSRNTYAEQLIAQGGKKKIGVGRKITYDLHLEEMLLSYSMVERENKNGLSIKQLKQKAIELIQENNISPNDKFKGSDGWAKKFCKRNLFDINNKFNCPRYFPNDLLRSAHQFLHDFSLKNKYLSNNILFMDEVVFDFSFLKKYKARNRKKASLILTLTKEGILLKPFLVYCSNIEPDKVAGETSIPSMQTENGEVDETVLEQWLSESLFSYIQGCSSLLLMDSWDRHKSTSFINELNNNNVETMILPPGVGCIINPLKFVIPYMNDTVMELAKISDCANRKHKRVKKSMIQEWILVSLNKVMIDHPEYLYSAFDCLK